MAAAALALTGAVFAPPAPAGAQQPLSPLGQALESLPNPPEAQNLPGASSVPDVSSIPGAPQVQGITNSGAPPVTDPAVGGVFSAPFTEPGPNCIETHGSVSTQGAAGIACKPAAMAAAVLPTGNILYWNGIEAEENAKYSIVVELGDRAVNDQSRLLDLNYGNPSGSTWTNPTPVDGGANGQQYSEYLVPNAPAPFDQIFNDPGNAPGALFCSDSVFLANGDLLVPGGTQYYSEPHLPGTNFGLAELAGLKNTRIYNVRSNSWTQVKSPMHFGRWYPSLVTLPDGKVFTASGVTKLLKPIYTTHITDSGTNVKQTETYDPFTQTWTLNPDSASRTLPLYPRLHLLPDGKVFYDAAGQVFNPAGESYDEALWNIAAVYDPTAQTWTNVGVPAGVSIDPSRPLDTALSAGFRGSSFDMMLPLKPPYTEARFLSAGGVLGTTPGAYLANSSSVIDTVDTSNHHDTFTSTPTAPLHNARWFSSAVLLPTGQVIAFNGANRDDVVGPGTTFPVRQAEMFDPATGQWTPLASSHHPRTYHNSAVLLPTGQVLVGGNAPISTLYGYSQTIPGGFSNDFHDPSFELYDPPYLHWGYAQPAIAGAPSVLGHGSNSFTIATPDAGSIASVVLMRNTAFTHLVDGDQRSVELTIQNRSANTLTVAEPPSAAVAPPGPYELFINKTTPKGLVPSQAKQVLVG